MDVSDFFGGLTDRFNERENPTSFPGDAPIGFVQRSDTWSQRWAKSFSPLSC
jgi:hypothetical protein